MSKTVRFLIGPSQVGKTTARKKDPVLRELPCVDIYDVQVQLKEEKNEKPLDIDDVWKSYEITRDRLVEALDEHDDVVLEHTLLKAFRRPMFMEAVREKYPDAKIICYYVLPDLEEYLSHHFLIEEGEFLGGDAESQAMAAQLNRIFIENQRKKIRGEYEVFEIPTEEEGFDEVIKLC